MLHTLYEGLFTQAAHIPYYSPTFQVASGNEVYLDAQSDGAVSSPSFTFQLELGESSAAFESYEPHSLSISPHFVLLLARFRCRPAASMGRTSHRNVRRALTP